MLERFSSIYFFFRLTLNNFLFNAHTICRRDYTTVTNLLYNFFFVDRLYLQNLLFSQVLLKRAHIHFFFRLLPIPKRFSFVFRCTNTTFVFLDDSHIYKHALILIFHLVSFSVSLSFFSFQFQFVRWFYEMDLLCPRSINRQK